MINNLRDLVIIIIIPILLFLCLSTLIEIRDSINKLELSRIGIYGYNEDKDSWMRIRVNENGYIIIGGN